MRAVYLFSVWVHIVAAAWWVGGMLFLVFVLIPVTRRPEVAPVRAQLVHWVGLRFRWVGWVSLVLLVASGAFNLAYRGIGWGDLVSPRLWEGRFGRVLALKLVLVAAVLVLSALHDFALGPRATSAWKARPDSAEATRLRRRASWLARIELLLALLILGLAVLLVRGGA